MDANALFDVFRNDVKMKKFLPIIENFDRYPVFYDKTRQVLSLPPILPKTKVCLAILAAQFSEHCGKGW